MFYYLCTEPIYTNIIVLSSVSDSDPNPHGSVLKLPRCGNTNPDPFHYKLKEKKTDHHSNKMIPPTF
jgi:hypothetical protein